jgi:endo-1,3-1,4-beta-glycanase ExoK
MTKQAINTRFIAALASMGVACLANTAYAVSSAEFYTAESYQYGRFEARIQFAAGDGVISSFFLWKDGSEVSGTFWNELDFEKLGADCYLETNAYYGKPAAVHSEKSTTTADLCGKFHTYTYEWTPEYIAWLIDGVEIRRVTGAAATAYAENATAGMQLRFNIWPGNASFGGNFSPDILPVHQYINWVQYSSYADGAFTLKWREDFNATTAPSGWRKGNWESPKNLSTHNAANVTFMNGYAVLSLTADDALGSAGAAPNDPDDPGTTPTTGGSTSTGTSINTGGASTAGGASSTLSAIAGSPGLAGASSSVPAQTTESDGGCSITGTHTKRTSGVLAWLGIAVGVILRQRHQTKRTRAVKENA